MISARNHTEAEREERSSSLAPSASLFRGRSSTALVGCIPSSRQRAVAVVRQAAELVRAAMDIHAGILTHAEHRQLWAIHLSLDEAARRMQDVRQCGR